MSAVRRQSLGHEWWAEDDYDDERTQAVPVQAVRRAAALRAVPAGAGRHRQGAPARFAYAAAPAGRPAALTALPDLSRVLTTAGAIAGLALLLYLGITGLIGWARVKLDDMHYGRPRTAQTDAYVGHGESAGAPTHFVAMNLNRRVTIIEFPGGDVTKPQVIAGPYLFGRSEDLTVVKLAVADVNGDDKPDLTVHVKDERLVYINENGGFRPITADELAQIKSTEGGR